MLQVWTLPQNHQLHVQSKYVFIFKLKTARVAPAKGALSFDFFVDHCTFLVKNNLNVITMGADTYLFHSWKYDNCKWSREAIDDWIIFMELCNFLPDVLYTLLSPLHQDHLLMNDWNLTPAKMTSQVVHGKACLVWQSRRNPYNSDTWPSLVLGIGILRSRLHLTS